MSAIAVISHVTKILEQRVLRMSKYFSRYNLEPKITQYLDSVTLERVLIIGAGGQLESIVRRYPSKSIISIDIAPARKPNRVMSVTRLDFAEDSFDQIFMLEVLEHVTEPHLAASEIHRVLAPHGVLILSTPFTFWSAR